MCVLFVYLNNTASEDEYRLILASNRDEYFWRPAMAAHFWGSCPEILAGMDITHGKRKGTWLGASVNGRIGVLLNDCRIVDTPEKRGRGPLVAEYLLHKGSSKCYLNYLHSKSMSHNAFQLVVMDFSGENSPLCHYSSIDACKTDFTDGCHSFCNSALEKPFQKASFGKRKLLEIVQKIDNKAPKNQDLLVSRTLQLLQNTKRNIPDEVLQEVTSVCDDWKPALSAINVKLPEIYGYGTRTHSIITVGGDGTLEFYEWNRKEGTSALEYTRLQVQLQI